MANLLTINESDFDDKADDSKRSSYTERSAARGVLLDQSGKVYLLNVSKHSYHKLPGGGIDPGEKIIEAFKRELLEEVGCNGEVIQELGKVIEYRHFFSQKQTSYCFLAQQVGEQMESSLEEGEIAEGMYEVKAANIDDAIRILEQDNPDNMEGKYIQMRDITILKAARKYIN
ncbi:NUDIX domain-containing protein [Candidatus Saccharibacteria bacterium]|nr:NUDIX domain-containing protein [Candidatus Saccharibacteria bacterium]